MADKLFFDSYPEQQPHINDILWSTLNTKAKELEIFTLVKQNIDRAKEAGLVFGELACIREIALACFDEPKLATVLGFDHATKDIPLHSLGPVVAQKNVRLLSLLFTALAYIDVDNCVKKLDQQLFSQTISVTLRNATIERLNDRSDVIPKLARDVLTDLGLFATGFYARGLADKKVSEAAGRPDNRVLVPSQDTCDARFIQEDKKSDMVLYLCLNGCKVAPQMADVFDENSTMPLALLLEKTLRPELVLNATTDERLNDIFYEMIWECISSPEVVAQLTSLVARPYEGKPAGFAVVKRDNYGDYAEEHKRLNFPPFPGKFTELRNWYPLVLAGTIGLLRLAQVTGRPWIPFRLLGIFGDKLKAAEPSYCPLLGCAKVGEESKVQKTYAGQENQTN